jgi:hypothetical protein
MIRLGELTDADDAEDRRQEAPGVSSATHDERTED